MAKYFMHYAGQAFQCADAEAAGKAVLSVEKVKRVRGNARLLVRTTTGAVHVFVDPTTQIAFSAENADGTDLPEPDPV